MKPLVFLAIMLLVETGCHRPFGPFHNTDKWLLHRDLEFRPLNDHPKEITEYNYRASNMDKPEKRRQQYDRYRFNTDGDLISREIYFNDTLLSLWKGKFDSNGCQWTDTDLIAHQIETRTTRQLGDGHYKTIDKYENSSPHAEIVSFSPDGREFMRSIYDDTIARGKAQQFHYYYNGIRITKVEGSGKKADFEKRYYYSRWDTPDSIELYAVTLIPWVAEREYYLINGHGDPTRHLRVEGRDTLEVQVYQYWYDSHGNWTRKISTTLKDKTGEKHDYDLSVPRVVNRVFVY